MHRIKEGFESLAEQSKQSEFGSSKKIHSGRGLARKKK